MNRTRVLIVDDSATIRRLIRGQLERNPRIEVVGEAADPLEARAAIPKVNPDVLTLDIEMPNMSGLQFLEKLMRLRPMPVVMVSSLTQQSTHETIRALELGAVACLGKPSGPQTSEAFSELPNIVLEAAKAKNLGASNGKASSTSADRDAAKPAGASYDPGKQIIMIGSSTGGVEALFQVLKDFPENCPPTFITQHIPAHFSKSFAQRLQNQCAPEVLEATDGLTVKKGMVVIAPGTETHLELVMRPNPQCRLVNAPKESGHRPSVDVLFKSGVPVAKRISAAILTGMGQDGARGLLELKNGQARTFAQNEATCVVYGMPRAAYELGAVDKPLPLRRISGALLYPN